MIEQFATASDEELLAELRGKHAVAVETTLLEHARTTDPRTITLLGRRILAHLDPDGPSPTEERLQQSHRSVTVTQGLLNGQLTSTCQAIWDAVLTPLAVRRPDEALGPDDRTPGQRLPDAFEEAGRRLLKSAQLPPPSGAAQSAIARLRACSELDCPSP